MSTGDFFYHTAHGLECIGRYSSGQNILLDGKEYVIKLMLDGYVSLTNTEIVDDLKKKMCNMVDGIKNEITKREDDITFLRAEIASLEERATETDDIDDLLKREVGDKTTLICKHKREIKKLKRRSLLDIRYTETIKTDYFQLPPFCSTYVKHLNCIIVWCPGTNMSKKRKHISSHSSTKIVPKRKKVKMSNGDIQTNMKTVIYQPRKLGMKHYGNLVTAVTINSQSGKAGVRVGWVIDSINGKKMPCNRKIIKDAIAALKKESVPIEIVFLVNPKFGTWDGVSTITSLESLIGLKLFEVECSEQCFAIKIIKSSDWKNGKLLMRYRYSGYFMFEISTTKHKRMLCNVGRPEDYERIQESNDCTFRRIC